MSNEIKDISTRMTEVMNTPGFSSLSKKDQSEVINQLTTSYKNDAGLFGKMFGNRQDSTIIYITLILCILLLIIGLVVMIAYQEFCSEYWKGAFPILAGAFGYMYGKNSKKD